MDKRFDNIPLESNIIVLASIEAFLDKYLVCLRITAWGEMRLTSLIMVTEEIAHVSDEKIIDLIQKSRYYNEGSIDITRGAEYVMVEFNYFIDEFKEFWL